MRFHIDRPPRSGDRRTMGGLFIQPGAQKLPQPEGIGRSPCNAAFGIDPLEGPDRQQPEVGSRCQRRASIAIRLKPRALPLAEFVELLAVRRFVQPFIERMSRPGSQFRAHNPEPLPALPAFAGAHRHKNMLQPKCF